MKNSKNCTSCLIAYLIIFAFFIIPFQAHAKNEKGEGSPQKVFSYQNSELPMQILGGWKSEGNLFLGFHNGFDSPVVSIKITVYFYNQNNIPLKTTRYAGLEDTSNREQFTIKTFIDPHQNSELIKLVPDKFPSFSKFMVYIHEARFETGKLWTNEQKEPKANPPLKAEGIVLKSHTLNVVYKWISLNSVGHPELNMVVLNTFTRPVIQANFVASTTDANNQEETQSLLMRNIKFNPNQYSIIITMTLKQENAPVKYDAAPDEVKFDNGSILKL